MIFDTSFLKKFIVEHPISLSGLFFSFFFYCFVSFLLFASARLGFNIEQIESIAGENMAPKTFELFGTVILIVLSIRALCFGPAGIPLNKHLEKMTAAVSNAAISIQAAIAGIQLGANLVKALPSLGFLNYVGVCKWGQAVESILLLLFAYVLVLTFTISKTTAPAYASRKFSIGYRALSAFFLFVLCGRSVVLLHILNNASGK